MKQSTTSSSSIGIAVDFEESKAIEDVAVIEEGNVVNEVIAVNETPAEDITLNLDSEELHYLCQEEKWCDSYIDLFLDFNTEKTSI